MRVVRWIGFGLLLLTALAFSAPALWAQAAPPATHLLVSREAAVFLDSLATEARAVRVENAGCVTRYSVRDTLVTIERIGPATYTRADSVGIWTNGDPICPPGVPGIHSHMGVDFVTDHPSDIDFATAKRVGVWQLLLSVMDNGYLLRIYAGGAQ